MRMNKSSYMLAFHTLCICVFGWALCGCGPKGHNDKTGSGHTADRHADSELPCVIVSTTDLKGIVEAISGDKIELHSFGKGNQDPHDLDILPSYVREMNDADLWVQVGNGIEAAWYPNLIRNANNPDIIDGAEGFMDVSQGVTPLEGIVGDILGAGHNSGVHEAGNPHYLLDPLEGIRVAELVTRRLSKMLPDLAVEFAENLDKFRDPLAKALMGEALAERHDVVQIADMYMAGTLDSFLEQQGHGLALQGWLGELKEYRGTVIVGDHDLWPYFSRRIGLSVLGYFEPEPGIPPTTKHLQALIAQMKAQSVQIILSAPYFDKRHATFVSENTGAVVLPMCHQTQARPATETYFDMVRHNMETIIQGLKQTQSPAPAAQ